MMDLTVRVREADDVPIVELSGEMDAATCGSVRDCVFGLIDRGSRRIVVNLDCIDYVDSTGLGTMVGVLKRMNEQNGELRLSFNNPLISKVFEVTGLGRIFCITRTDEEALLSLAPDPKIPFDA